MNKWLITNYKILIGIVIGLLFSSCVYAVSRTINSNSIIYDNSNGMGSTNIQDAIDELYNIRSVNVEYNATDVSLTTKYNSSVKTLKEALDDLYERVGE